MELLRDIRTSFDEWDQLDGSFHRFISVWFPADVSSIDNLTGIVKYCDFVILNTHDYYNGEKLIKPHAPLDGNGGDNIVSIN